VYASAASIASPFAVATSASVAKDPESVVEICTSAVPSKDTEPVRSPVSSIVRDVSSAVAVEALPDTSPVRFAVIVPAAKLPEPSRFTTVSAVLADVAVPPIRLTI
jgi:hypothetical protein